ncbi:MAG: cytochrome C, partial [Desulfuromonadales bacterium]|nr:cytochrome C [Desulfuromonadales bacterium]
GDCAKCHEGEPAKIAVDKDFAHTTCKGCHKEMNGPTKCNDCHKK